MTDVSQIETAAVVYGSGAADEAVVSQIETAAVVYGSGAADESVVSQVEVCCVIELAATGGGSRRAVMVIAA
jgi:hypothetical protein